MGAAQWRHVSIMNPKRTDIVKTEICLMDLIRSRIEWRLLSEKIPLNREHLSRQTLRLKEERLENSLLVSLRIYDAIVIWVCSITNFAQAMGEMML